MQRYKFKARISKKSDRLPGKEYSPKGFYYQGKNELSLTLITMNGAVIEKL